MSREKLHFNTTKAVLRRCSVLIGVGVFKDNSWPYSPWLGGIKVMLDLHPLLPLIARMFLSKYFLQSLGMSDVHVNIIGLA